MSARTAAGTSQVRRVAMLPPSLTQTDTIGRRVPRPTVAATPSLLYWRMQRGFLQKQLGDKAGVDRATVARLEAGGQSRLDTISKLAAALGITPGELQAQPPET